jgi:hypothetical protein
MSWMTFLEQPHLFTLVGNSFTPIPAAFAPGK